MSEETKIVDPLNDDDYVKAIAKWATSEWEFDDFGHCNWGWRYTGDLGDATYELCIYPVYEEMPGMLDGKPGDMVAELSIEESRDPKGWWYQVAGAHAPADIVEWARDTISEKRAEA